MTKSLEECSRHAKLQLALGFRLLVEHQLGLHIDRCLQTFAEHPVAAKKQLCGAHRGKLCQEHTLRG